MLNTRSSSCCIRARRAPHWISCCRRNLRPDHQAAARTSPSRTVSRRPKRSWLGTRRRPCGLELEKQKLPPERVGLSSFPTRSIYGDRPSTIVAFAQLDPATLGRLVALLLSTRCSPQSVVWGIKRFRSVGCGGSARSSRNSSLRRFAILAGRQPAQRGVTRLLEQLDKWRRAP